MDTDTVQPVSVTEEVKAVPAPVLQLLYAHYYLSNPRPSRRPAEPDWLARLRKRAPELVDELAASGLSEGRHHFFTLAAELGYWDGSDPSRFLADLPELPGSLLEQLQAGTDNPQPGLEAWLTARQGEGDRWQRQFRELHAALAEEWRSAGEATVTEHCRQFLERYREHGDVIKALPPYHFIRFEKTALPIRSAEGQQQIVVVPLYFAAAGGFSFGSGGRQFVGFGLRSEYLFEDTRSRVMRDARSIKALADPTRLLLLTLIARYSGFALTVGDLAQYLAVSQPTVSGHLKVLRDSGLVEVERHGNRSLYRPDTAAIRELIMDLEDTLLPG